MKPKQSRKASDTEIDLSYDILNALRDSMFMSAFSVKDMAGRDKIILRLMFRTKDGKIHQITNTEFQV